MKLNYDSPASSESFNHCRLGDVEVLTRLGLTGRQARVYLALLKTGDARVQTVADPSRVNRQEIYRLLDSLMQLGLVQRNITAPITFKATPIKDGIKLLLEQKNSELSIIGQQAKRLTEKLNQNSPTVVDLKPCFGTVSEADRGKKYRKSLQEVQHSVMGVTSWSQFKQLNLHFEAQLQSILKKDVLLYIVTEKPSNFHLPKWVNAALSRNPNFKLKTQPNPPAAALTLFDQTTAAVAFNSNTRLTNGPILWTTNPGIIAFCQAYLSKFWE